MPRRHPIPKSPAIAREPDRRPRADAGAGAPTGGAAGQYRRPNRKSRQHRTIIEETIEPPTNFGAREDVAALQVLLDRRGASPGVIDGRFGSNVDKAIVSYRSITGRT